MSSGVAGGGRKMTPILRPDVCCFASGVRGILALGGGESLGPDCGGRKHGRTTWLDQGSNTTLKHPPTPKTKRFGCPKFRGTKLGTVLGPDCVCWVWSWSSFADGMGLICASDIRHGIASATQPCPNYPLGQHGARSGRGRRFCRGWAGGVGAAAPAGAILCMYTCISVFMGTCMYACMFACTFACMCSCMHAHRRKCR